MFYVRRLGEWLVIISLISKWGRHEVGAGLHVWQDSLSCGHLARQARLIGDQTRPYGFGRRHSREIPFAV